MSIHTSGIHLCLLSSLHSSSLRLKPESNTFCECHRIRTTALCVSLLLRSILNTDESLHSPFSFLPFVPPLAPTIPAPRLPGSLQPSPLPLPRSSIVSAWFSSLSLSCSMQPCLASLSLLCSLSQTHSSLPVQFRLRGGEGKHFKLQGPARKKKKQTKKQDSTELIYRLWKFECSPTSIDLFLWSWNILILSVSGSRSSSPGHFSLASPWFTLSKQQTCSPRNLLALQFADKLHGNNMSSFGRCLSTLAWFTAFLTQPKNTIWRKGARPEHSTEMTNPSVKQPPGYS